MDNFLDFFFAVNYNVYEEIMNMEPFPNSSMTDEGLCARVVDGDRAASDRERRFRVMKINFVLMYALKENNIAPRRLRKFAEALV